MNFYRISEHIFNVKMVKGYRCFVILLYDELLETSINYIRPLFQRLLKIKTTISILISSRFIRQFRIIAGGYLVLFWIRHSREKRKTNKGAHSR